MRRARSSRRTRLVHEILSKKRKEGDIVVIQYEGSEGWPRHAGNAVPDLLPEGSGPWQEVR